MSLTSRILIAMVAGLVVGLGLHYLIASVGSDSAVGGFIVTYLTDGAFDIGGQIFIRSLKLLVVPMVFVSLVCGVCALGEDSSRLGAIAGKSLGLYMCTTAIAITLAMSAAMLIQPGAGIDLSSATDYAAKQAPSFKEVLINIFPSNPVEAMAEGNMLQVIVFSLLFGFALSKVGEAGKVVREFFMQLNDVIMYLVNVLMSLAPYGVFCLLAALFANIGLEILGNLAVYFFTVAGVLLLHGFVVYGGLVKLVAGRDPIRFLRKMRPVQLFAFSTSSSNATMPVTLDIVKNRLGVNNSVASFTVPLGATINMDGTAIMQGVATAFIAQAYGVDLGLSGFLAVIATATMASIGTAGVPGVGLIMLAMVLQQVNLPVEGIAMIIGVDRLLDMLRTAVNVTGDAAVTCVVANSEGQLDQTVYDTPAEQFEQLG